MLKFKFKFKCRFEVQVQVECKDKFEVEANRVKDSRLIGEVEGEKVRSN